MSEQKQTLEERLKSDLPHMQRNLHELEMKLAWMNGECEKLKTVIENQRGAIMNAERLLAPDINEVVAGAQPDAPVPTKATSRKAAKPAPLPMSDQPLRDLVAAQNGNSKDKVTKRR